MIHGLEKVTPVSSDVAYQPAEPDEAAQLLIERVNNDLRVVWSDDERIKGRVLRLPAHDTTPTVLSKFKRHGWLIATTHEKLQLSGTWTVLARFYPVPLYVS